LHKLPVTEIKIDRNFIHGCESSAYHQVLIESFVAIGRTLSIEVTATGVENEMQRRVLERLGIRQAQGFLFGAPIDAAEFAALADGQASGMTTDARAANRLSLETTGLDTPGMRAALPAPQPAWLESTAATLQTPLEG
jgi:predicted signal transduction protein with EAL and GGDEF domain